jgi:hypothetical protein
MALGAALLLGLTAVIWFQARGLEARLLGAVQPHLATDVRVGSVSVTVLDSWPNVEVDLGDVRIEDAVKGGEDFLELRSLGVVFAWYPLIFGRLEVAEIKAEGGHIHVHRHRDGSQNWQFWKPNEGAESGIDWTLESVILKGVQLEGEWWSSGASDPVTWSTQCTSAALALKAGGDQEWAVAGTVALQTAELDAAGERWLNVVDLSTEIDLNVEGGDVQVILSDAEMKNQQGAVDFSASIGSGGGFQLALLCENADGAALLSLVPPGLTDQLEELPSISGAADVEVLVGTDRAQSGWSGPQDGNWSKGWAVRVAPKSLGALWKELPAQLKGGTAVAYPIEEGWALTFEDVLGGAADGEFRCSGRWSSQRGVDDVAIEGEVVARPEGVLPWLGEGAELPSGWELKEGGVVRAQFDLECQRRPHEAWTWTGGVLEVRAIDIGVVLPLAGNSEGLPLNVGEAQLEVGPEGWDVALIDVEGWGVEGGVEIGGASDADAVELKASIVRCDVNRLLAAASAVQPAEDRSASTLPVVQWSVGADQLIWGALTVRSIKASGSYNLERQKGVLSALNARAFDGGVAAHGGWDLGSINLEGAVVDVDVSSFLEGTKGLGQNTLLPSHLRGRAWAEGTLNHHFGKAPNLAWETDLNVRLEKAELLDFDLLQRIPETLKAEGKYRFISDAEDLSKRLMRVRFEPLEAQVSLSRGVFTLEPTEVVSDAMNVGIAGWQRLSGGMDYTLDFALRDLKSDREEFGVTADDGLGHRFFLAIGGTLDAPEFGYDRTAHKSHRQGERRSALGRLKGLILGEEEGSNAEQGPSTEIMVQDSLREEKAAKAPLPTDFEDDDDDFTP